MKSQYKKKLKNFTDNLLFSFLTRLEFIAIHEHFRKIYNLNLFLFPTAKFLGKFRQKFISNDVCEENNSCVMKEN